MVKLQHFKLQLFNWTIVRENVHAFNLKQWKKLICFTPQSITAINWEGTVNQSCVQGLTQVGVLSYTLNAHRKIYKSPYK